jgi:hypothetical protein
LIEYGASCDISHEENDVYEDSDITGMLLHGLVTAGHVDLLKELILNFDVNPNEGPIYEEDEDEDEDEEEDEDEDEEENEESEDDDEYQRDVGTLYPTSGLFESTLSMMRCSFSFEAMEAHHNIAKFLLIEVPIFVRKCDMFEQDRKIDEDLNKLFSHSSYN